VLSTHAVKVNTVILKNNNDCHEKSLAAQERSLSEADVSSQHHCRCHPARGIGKVYIIFYSKAILWLIIGGARAVQALDGLAGNLAK
jgi:hypothetical protein